MVTCLPQQPPAGPGTRPRARPGDPLGCFSELTRAWFTSAFAAPTPAQVQAWESISSGRHTLVVAPTGSGKTLAAFLWALDRLAVAAVPEDPSRRCRVLYVSPLKALAVDIERNLRAPLAGLRQAAHRLGLPQPNIKVAVRSGDTAAEERRRLAGSPPDILITTPESLFLLLTSRARETLGSVQTVIVDEVHALAGNKRGAHLALSLERLDALRIPNGCAGSATGPAQPDGGFRGVAPPTSTALTGQDRRPGQRSRTGGSGGSPPRTSTALAAPRGPAPLVCGPPRKGLSGSPLPGAHQSGRHRPDRHRRPDRYSESACPRQCARPQRSPRSSAATGQWRSPPHRLRSGSSWRSWYRSRT